MNNANTLNVVTEVGTFTRRTKRTYTHIVVVNQQRFEVLEAIRLAELEYAKRLFVEYSDPVAHFTPRAHALAFDTECHNKYLADGSYAKRATAAAERVATLEARGAITVDVDAPFKVLGWCGRADLAAKLAATEPGYREVRIYEVATGKRVR